MADQVSGKFVYGVMGASALTFTFWSTVAGLYKWHPDDPDYP